MARVGNPRRVRVSAVVLARRAAAAQLFRPQDGRPLCAPWPELREVVAEPSPALVSDLAASFQEAVVDAIVAKTRQALERTGMTRLGVGGGVAANNRLREKLGEMAAATAVELFIPPAALCTDNAAMAGIALPKLAAGQVAGLDIDVTAGTVRPGRPLA